MTPQPVARNPAVIADRRCASASIRTTDSTRVRARDAVVSSSIMARSSPDSESNAIATPAPAIRTIRPVARNHWAKRSSSRTSTSATRPSSRSGASAAAMTSIPPSPRLAIRPRSSSPSTRTNEVPLRRMRAWRRRSERAPVGLVMISLWTPLKDHGPSVGLRASIQA